MPQLRMPGGVGEPTVFGCVDVQMGCQLTDNSLSAVVGWTGLPFSDHGPEDIRIVYDHAGAEEVGGLGLACIR